MAKKAYIGVDGVARKIKKGYIGIDGIARKIKKAYIGVGGVARPCWSSGLEYYGRVTPLSVGVINPAATNTTNYGLFAGGEKSADGMGTNNSNRYSEIVDAFDKNNTRFNASSFSSSRTYVGAASVNGVAMFAGGSRGSDTKLNDVFKVNNDLTIAKSSTNLSANQDRLRATYVGDCVVFGHGVTTNGGWVMTYYFYNTDLTQVNKLNPTNNNKGYSSATTVANKAIFAGGSGGTNHTPSKTIHVFDDSYTEIETGIQLSIARAYIGATTVEGKAIFGGGSVNGERKTTVDVFNEDLTLISGVDNLSEARGPLPAVTNKDCALFIGGEIKGGKSATVDAYNADLVRTVPQGLSEARNQHAVTTVEDFILIGGGATPSAERESSIEAYIYS